MEKLYVENTPCEKQEKSKLSLLADILIVGLGLLKLGSLITNVCF